VIVVIVVFGPEVYTRTWIRTSRVITDTRIIRFEAKLLRSNDSVSRDDLVSNEFEGIALRHGDVVIRKG